MRWTGALLMVLCWGNAYSDVLSVAVKAEEDVYAFVNPNNGSGPLWSYGCSPVARLGDHVYVSQMETGVDVPPLANTRWRLLRREASGWRMVAEEAGYRQREPAVLAQTSNQRLYLNVDDSVEPPGVKYGKAEPSLLRFVFDEGGMKQEKVLPEWAGQPNFTDHSYRGFAADRGRGELLMLNIDAKTSVQNACLLSDAGKTLATGSITFPIRACYPQVQLRQGAAYVLAVGDIVEPVEAWRTYKFEQTKQSWDYVFRILYFTSTPDLQKQPFAPPVEIANVDASAGHISNKDLWVDEEGSAWILYTEQEVQSALMRDKFFPGKSVTPALKLAVVKNGAVVARRTLLEALDQRPVGDARFQVGANGALYAVLYVGGQDAGLKLLRVRPAQEEMTLVPVPLAKPMSGFLLASVRAGNPPSNLVDLIGMRDANSVGYACFEIK